MSPFVALHATNSRHRGGILYRGLISTGIPGTIHAVYVFREDSDIDHPTFGGSLLARRIRWSCGRGQDIWTVAYIGPMMPDPYVENGMMLLGHASIVTLVTGN